VLLREREERVQRRGVGERRHREARRREAGALVKLVLGVLQRRGGGVHRDPLGDHGLERAEVHEHNGAEDEAAFFSVATESFFERGAFLRTHQPALYELLREYFNQDPAAWPLPPSRPEAEAVSGRERRRLRRAAERRMAKRRS